MNVSQLLPELQDKLSKAHANLNKELSRLRTGRANLQVFEEIRVDYYGTFTPLNQVANLSISDPKLITIKPWEKSLVQEIERAINQADLGLHAQADAELVRVPIPILSQERRTDLTKVAKKLSEESRVAIRNVRRDINEAVKAGQKNKEVSEDEAKQLLEKIQQAVDKSIKQVDEMLAKKEKEIMDL